MENYLNKILFFFSLQSGSNSTSTGSGGSVSGKKPFFLHPPNESQGELQQLTGNGKGSLRDPEISSHKILPPGGSTTDLQQPNLDKRLRQYSAYELNRKIPKNKATSNTPSTRSSLLSKNQIPPLSRDHNTQ